jgi:colanic acid biosynthesis glycosyl transferase WcaI
VRVLLLTPHYPPEVRSVSILMSQLAEDLAALGHTVTVIAPHPPSNMHEARSAWDGEGAVPDVSLVGGDGAWGPAGPRAAADRIQVLRVPVLPFVKVAPSVRAVTHFTLAAAMVGAGLRAGRHDVVLVYSPPLPLALAAELLARRWRAPFIVNVQDLYPQALIDLGLARSRIVIRVLEWLERRAYRHSSAITVHSPGNREMLVARGIPPAKIAVVPNWIDIASARPASRDSPYRRELGLEGRFVVLFAGVMGYAQDMSVIIEAAAALRDEPGIVFLLAGDGVRRQEAEDRVRARHLDTVRFLPFQPIERYPLLVGAADCCLVTLQPAVATPVVPSKIAGILAAARPVVGALPPGDARALVEASGGGICVEPGDWEALARAIGRLARDPGMRQQMGEAGRRYAEAHFSRHRATRTYGELIDAVVRAAWPAGARQDT